jgi:hypothetical protein
MVYLIELFLKIKITFNWIFLFFKPNDYAFNN